MLHPNMHGAAQTGIPPQRVPRHKGYRAMLYRIYVGCFYVSKCFAYQYAAPLEGTYLGVSYSKVVNIKIVNEIVPPCRGAV